MYSIPFLIYKNDKFKKESIDDNLIKNYKHRAYSSSNLIYTFTDLAGLNFKEFDSTKSIINKNYLDYPILIGNPEKKNKLRDIRSL